VIGVCVYVYECVFVCARTRRWQGTFGGMSRARSGMWRSPITRMRKAIVPLGTIMGLRRYRVQESCLNGSYRVQGDSAKSVELQQER
jgi:hypothetical protein